MVMVFSLFFIAADFNVPDIASLTEWKLLPDRNLLMIFEGVSYKYEILAPPEPYYSCAEQRNFLQGAILVNAGDIGCIIRHDSGLFVGPPVNRDVLTFGYLVPAEPTAVKFWYDMDWRWVYKKTWFECSKSNLENNCDHTKKEGW